MVQANGHRPTVLLIADSGRAADALLRTDLAAILRAAGVRTVALVEDPDDEAVAGYARASGTVLERYRAERARQYWNSAALLRPVEYIRRTSLSGRIPSATLRDKQNEQAARLARRKLGLAYNLIVGAGQWSLKNSALARRAFGNVMAACFAPPFHAEVFAKWQPDLVVGNSPGYMIADIYVMREARRRGIRTLAAVLGWDNTITKGLPGAPVDYATVWSEQQKKELVLGGDLDPGRVFVVGAPAYDLLMRAKGTTSRDEYFAQHGLDPKRRLVTYACTLMSYTPNLHIVEALAKAVADDALGQPAQLLVRTHPDAYREPHTKVEMEALRQLCQSQPQVHLAEVSTAAKVLRAWGWEGYQETAAFLSHSDVFVSIFSTMMVEAAIFDRPLVSACIDSVSGWPGHPWRRITSLMDWPMHRRLIESQAGAVARSGQELVAAVAQALQRPEARSEARRSFALAECTYLDGQCARRLADRILSILNSGASQTTRRSAGPGAR